MRWLDLFDFSRVVFPPPPKKKVPSLTLPPGIAFGWSKNYGVYLHFSRSWLYGVGHVEGNEAEAGFHRIGMEEGVKEE